jgi:uncharacterized protein YndB with AHSA1/START domain
MTVTDVRTSTDDLTIVFTCEFDASPEQVWRLWADPRLLERWWGPPSHPATVTEHDLVPGGLVRYHMTGPDGETYPGGFRFTQVEPPTTLAFEDFFADEAGQPDPDMPTSTTRVQIEGATDGTTRMTLTSTSPSLDAMNQLLEMGAVEGMTAALGQIDTLLEIARSSA